MYTIKRMWTTLNEVVGVMEVYRTSMLSVMGSEHGHSFFLFSFCFLFSILFGLGLGSGYCCSKRHQLLQGHRPSTKGKIASALF